VTAGPDAAQAAASWQALAPALAGAARMRVSRDGGRTYPRRGEQPLAARPPSQPATVPVYDEDRGTGRMLACDFDVARARAAGAPDPAAETAAQAASLAALVAGLGGRAIADASPRGGRHVYVLFARPLPWRELRDLNRALALRYTALDPAPMAGPGGQIRPPGSRHRSGGWQALIMPLPDAAAAAAVPCGPQVWAGLLRELAAELAAAAPVDRPGAAPAGAEPDGEGSAWLPRPGGRVPLPAGPAAIAAAGTWPAGRYAGRSEARMAVITAAAACGWQLAQVRDEIASGHWAGLASLYARRQEPRRLARLLPAEWKKAVTRLAGEKNSRPCHTSDSNSRTPHPGPPPDPRPPGDYAAIRMWVTAADCAAADPRRTQGWGGRAIAVRLVLTALGQAAMVSGSPEVEFGTRNLALHAGISYRTAARVLARLRDEPDPLITLTARHRLARADRYRLRIPDAYAEQATWQRRRAGRIEAVHPVFAVLGGTAALTYAALAAEQAPAAGVARTAALSSTAAAGALRLLAEYGLAGHGPRGWQRGPASLDQAAAAAGAGELHAERSAAYAADRVIWQALVASWLSVPASRAVPPPCPPRRPAAWHAGHRADRSGCPARGAPGPSPAAAVP